MNAFDWKRQLTAWVLISQSILIYAGNARIDPEGFTGKQVKPLVYGKHSMVVTNNPWASAAARHILNQGGNAVDAAVAALFVLGLTEPSSSGLGGGGFALTYNNGTKQVHAYDGREAAPHSATPDLFLHKNGQPITFNEAVLSYQSIGIPAEVALLSEIQHEEGRLAWSHLVLPAMGLAGRGFPMSSRLHDLLQQESEQRQTLLVNNPQVKALYFTPDGRVKPVGAMIKNTAYAKSLAIIAKNPRDFYTGQIGRDIVAKINQLAGKIVYKPSDLINYKPRESEPLCSNYRAYKLCSIPFASGGVTVLELMKLYAIKYSGSNDSDSNWLYYFLEASKLAYADRNQYIGDPRFVLQPLKGLLAENYLLERSKLVTNKALPTPVKAGVPMGAQRQYTPDNHFTEHGTTTLAIVDKQGNAISMTLTIEEAFGSHVFLDGFFLNNELTDFSFLATDRQGMPIANSATAFKRPRSAIAPTMVFDSKGELIALSGSTGGSQIICYVAKNLIQMLDFNMNAKDSVASGNLCAVNDLPVIEKNSNLIQSMSALNNKNESMTTRYLVSGTVNIKRAADGGWYGAADPRREGVAIGD